MSYRFQLTTALVLFIGVLAFLYFFTGVFGGTKIALTIRTNPDLTNGLVGHWTFDGKDMPQGQVNDVSGQGNHGSLTNNFATGTAYVSGKLGQALQFNGNVGGSGQCVRISPASSINNLSAMTLSMWLKPSVESPGIIMSKRESGPTNGWWFNFQGAAYLEFIADYDSSDLSASFNYSTAYVPLNIWTHVVLTWDGSADAANVRLYKNGETISIVSEVDGITSRSDDSGAFLVIGCRGDSGGAFRGLMDDVRVYNRVISATEIKRLYELGATTKVAKTITTNPDLKSGLVGHWTFDGDDLKNNATDRSGQGNTGYLITGFTGFTSTTTHAGKIGQALEFDGTNDYVALGATNSFSTGSGAPWTLTGWAKTDVVSAASQFIVGYGGCGGSDTPILGLESNLWLISTFGASNDLYSIVAPKVGEWTHLAATGDGSTLRLYVNGVLDNTKTDATNNPVSTAASVGGAPNACVSGYWDGLLDDVRVYSRALSAAEIKRLYDLGATTKIAKTITTNPDLRSGLVGHWTFDGNLNTTVSDSSGQGNHGYIATVTVATSSLVTAGKVGQALRFFDIVQCVDAGSASSLANVSALSISAWLKPSLDTPGVIMSKRGAGGNSGWQFYFQAPEYLEFLADYDSDLSAAYNYATPYVPLNTWTHVVLTWDGSTSFSNVHLYRNGEEISVVGGTNGTTNRADDSGNSLVIDCRGDLGDPFVGSMDDVRVYNRVISASEIKRLYELGR